MGITKNDLKDLKFHRQPEGLRKAMVDLLEVVPKSSL
jgi:hypothetical protein